LSRLNDGSEISYVPRRPDRNRYGPAIESALRISAIAAVIMLVLRVGEFVLARMAQ
jgi:hypothetical protein